MELGKWKLELRCFVPFSAYTYGVYALASAPATFFAADTETASIEIFASITWTINPLMAQFLCEVNQLCGNIMELGVINGWGLGAGNRLLPLSYMAMAALVTSALSPQTVKKATRADLLNKGPLDLLLSLNLDHSITTGIYLCFFLCWVINFDWRCCFLCCGVNQVHWRWIWKLL